MDVYGLFSFFCGACVFIKYKNVFLYVAYGQYPNIFSIFIFKKTNIQSLKENMF
jgi:hypothetical protein